MIDGLAELRKKIDALDEALVRLLNTRAACALEIGRVKKHAGLPIYQPSREADVLVAAGQAAADSQEMGLW